MKKTFLMTSAVALLLGMSANAQITMEAGAEFETKVTEE